MAEIKIRIKNMPEIRAAFAKSPARMVKALGRAIQLSVFSIERDSKINSPVRTGFLRASHRTLFSSLKGEVGPTASYAVFVHQGTRFMQPRPFLLNAVKSNKSKVQGFFKQAVQDTLDDIARDVG